MDVLRCAKCSVFSPGAASVPSLAAPAQTRSTWVSLPALLSAASGSSVPVDGRGVVVRKGVFVAVSLKGRGGMTGLAGAELWLF